MILAFEEYGIKQKVRKGKIAVADHWWLECKGAWTRPSPTTKQGANWYGHTCQWYLVTTQQSGVVTNTDHNNPMFIFIQVCISWNTKKIKG